MNLRVITPPAPIVVPVDIAGSHAANDAKVTAAIAAVTEELDGPTGWLGRAIGPQTLELTASCFGLYKAIYLPCPPVIGVDSVKYLDADLVEQTVDPDSYERLSDGSLRLKSGHWPAVGIHPEAARVRYQAGYNAVAVESGGTGPVPERIKQAIIVMVQDLIATKAENLFIRSEEVEGIGTRQFTVSDQAGTIIRRTADRLLNGLRIYA